MSISTLGSMKWYGYENKQTSFFLNQKSNKLKKDKRRRSNESLKIDEKRTENVQEKIVKLVQINSLYSCFPQLYESCTSLHFFYLVHINNKNNNRISKITDNHQFYHASNHTINIDLSFKTEDHSSLDDIYH